MNTDQTISRRAALIGTAAAAATMALASPALAAPSPLHSITARVRAACDTWMAAFEAADEADGRLMEASQTDPAMTFRKRSIYPVVGAMDTLTFRPFQDDRDGAWLEAIHHRHRYDVESFGRNVWGNRDRYMARIEAEYQADLTAYHTAKAAYFRAYQDGRANELWQAEHAAADAYKAARDELFTYQPRTMAKVAEKASILIDMGDEFEGWTEDRIAQMLASLGGKAVA